MINNNLMNFVCKCNMSFSNQQDLLIHSHSCQIISLNNDINNLTAIRRPVQIITNTIAIASQNCNNIITTNSICKYDSNTIEEVNKSEYLSVCCNPECIKEYLIKCNTTFECNHECLGLEVDSCEQFKCLNSKCKLYNNIYDQSEFNLCPICMTDNLNKFAILQLPCKHYVHKKCFERRLILKWNTKEISFNYIKCPVCNFFIKDNKISNDKDIIALFGEAKRLYDLVEKLGEEYNSNLKEEFTQSTQLNLDKYAFFICDKCGDPFCAGMRQCREGENDNNNDNDNDNKKLCLECFDYTKIKGITICESHGRKQIQYKCKFCCNISSYFCFGTTNFCEDCHMKQLKGEYLTKMDISDFQQCAGIDKCPLKIDHPPNGEEFGLYCLLCIK